MRKHDFEWKNHEQPWFSMKNHWKTLIFFRNLRKSLIFWSFCAPRKKAGPDNRKSYKMRPRRGTAGGKNAKRRSLLAKYVELKFLMKDVCELVGVFLYPKITPCKCFYIQKSHLCSPPQTGKVPEIWPPLQWKPWFLKFLGDPEKGPEGGSSKLGVRHGASYKGAQLPDQAKQGKSWFLKVGGSLFHGILKL